KLLQGDLAGAFTYSFTLPDWGNFDFQLPSLFALLSDPGTLVDGLDQVLAAIESALRGQVFGVKLPFISNALANNKISDDIAAFRTNVLQKIAKTIRDNNLH